jgi:large subunit ribosomal protein L28
MTKICELTGQKVVAGRNVSHTKGHPTRTSRDFIPNLKNTTFKSDALGINMTLRVATGTIRTINKYGSLDSFLINYRFAKLTDLAKKLRLKIEKSLLKNSQYENVKIIKVKKEKKVVGKKKDGKNKK